MIDAKNILVEKKIIKTKEGKLPIYFIRVNLTNLFVHQFVTWDKIYMKVIPRPYDGYECTTYKDHIMKFRHEVKEELDVSNVTYSREKVNLTKCKYIDHIRLCLGASVVTPSIDGVD